MRRFYSFCDRFHVFNPFPVTESILCSFAAFLADEKLSPQSIKTYLAAVRNIQISLGLPDPRQESSLPVLERVQAGITRTRFQQGTPSRIRLPITAGLLGRIRTALDHSSHPEKVLLWAVCCTAFFGFFRLGELLLDSSAAFNLRSHLAWGDVSVNDQAAPTVVKIHLKQSKTDQAGKGFDVILGRTGRELCPVAAVLGFIAVGGNRPGPFFVMTGAKPLTKARFITELRANLVVLGVPQDHYAGHSFRIGAATSAALAGVEDSTIQALGRWHSAAFLRYIRMPREQLAALSTVLAGSPEQRT